MIFYAEYDTDSCHNYSNNRKRGPAVVSNYLLRDYNSYCSLTCTHSVLLQSDEAYLMSSDSKKQRTSELVYVCSLASQWAKRPMYEYHVCTCCVITLCGLFYCIVLY